ncbi:MAG: LamG-like jellyroll fold domain-containing protein, partial [Patescibacteria group bacterium]
MKTWYSKWHHHPLRSYIHWSSFSVISLLLTFSILNAINNIYYPEYTILKTDKVYADTTTGLVGWWKFDKGSGTSATDSSGSDNTGTLTNGPAWTTGQNNGALSFNGANSCVNLSQPVALNLRGALTISIWINPTSSAFGKQVIGKGALGGGQSAQQFFVRDSGSNRFGFFVNNSTSSLGGDLSTANPIPNGTWAHFVGTYNGSDTVNIYQNGVLLKTFTSAGFGALNSTAGNMVIGATHGSSVCNSAFFNGLIDDVRVYSRALSADEVSAFYALGGSTVTTDNPPSVPASLTSSGITSTGATISWSASADPDSTPVAGYTIYRGGTQLATGITATTYTDSTLSPSTLYSYTVSAYDTAVPANASAQSSALSVTTPANPPPSGSCEAGPGNSCWYIDNTATAGLKNGTSWKDAWTNIGSTYRGLQVNWANIKPGDFVYISGGPSGSSQTYIGMLEPTTSGTAEKPITIKVGQDSSHNGLVIIDGAFSDSSTGWYGLNIGNQSYISMSGQVGNDPSPHFLITHSFYHGVNIVGASIQGIHLSYIEIADIGKDNWLDKTKKIDPLSGSDDPCPVPICQQTNGIHLETIQKNNIAEFDHIIIHNTFSEAIQLTESNKGSTLDTTLGSSIKVHHSDIYNFHGDGIKTSINGTDIYNNKIHDRGLHYFDHQDGIQFWANYVRIYNNQFYNFDGSINLPPADYDVGANSYIRYNPGDLPSGNKNSNPRYVYIYNNIFYETYPPTRHQFRGIEFSLGYLGSIVETVRNMYFVNNVIVNNPNNAIDISPKATMNADIREFYIVNNVFKDNCNSAVACSAFANLYVGYNNSVSYGGFGSGSNVIFDNNAVYASDPAYSTKISTKFNGTGFFTYPAYKVAFPGIQTHDVTINPMLDSNLLPLPGSPLINAGTNMGNIFSPPAGYGWNIGAYKSISSGSANPQDTIPPVISGGAPAGALPAGTISTTLSVTTNENATCKYSLSPGISYNLISSSNIFSASGNTSHSSVLAGLINGLSYTYYIKCQDSAGNANSSDYTINFTILSLPQASKLVLHINFESDNFGTGIFSDKSGNNNNADCQNAFPLNNTTYNQCPIAALGPDGSKSAKFQGTRCDVASDYLAVKKSGSLDNLTSGTISFWAAMDSNEVSTLLEKLIDTSGMDPGTWMIGRDGGSYLSFSSRTDGGSLEDFFTFPGANLALGSWNHYAVSWNGNTISGYFNGNLFSEISQKRFSSFKLGTYLTIGALNHGDTRNFPDNDCTNYYGADRTKQYVQPNDGFFNGKLDDIRIYNNQLSINEISALAAMTSSPTNSLLLSAYKTGEGAGVITGPSIDCGKHCAEVYGPGTTATLTATPNESSVFSGWSGVCSGIGTCTVSMSANKSVTAMFSRRYPVVASFEAESGTITAPFKKSINGAIFQDIEVSNPLAGGKAVYGFNAPVSGNYIISGLVNASSQANNSFFINIDTEPSIDNAWYLNTTSGLEERIASWGGYSSGGNQAKVFNLTAGNHNLIIRGRESFTYIDKIYIFQISGLSPDTTSPAVSITSPLNNSTI